MQNLKYSAGAVSKGFWFQEFKNILMSLAKENRGRYQKGAGREQSVYGTIS